MKEAVFTSVVGSAVLLLVLGVAGAHKASANRNLTLLVGALALALAGHSLGLLLQKIAGLL